eukprot:11543960-Alexandrium_andersonii.AAC.1
MRQSSSNMRSLYDTTSFRESSVLSFLWRTMAAWRPFTEGCKDGSRLSYVRSWFRCFTKRLRACVRACVR